MSSAVPTKRGWRVDRGQGAAYRSPEPPVGCSRGMAFELPRIGWVRVVRDDETCIEYERCSFWERLFLSLMNP